MLNPARRQRLILLLVGVSIALAAIAPVRNYDLFWHLATGRWIAEHRTLPANDPFAVASDRHAWVNGEWLFQLAVYTLERIGGLASLSFARGLFAGGLFVAIAILARRARRESSRKEPADVDDLHVVVLLTAVAFAGASPVLDVRPASLAMLFVVLGVSLRSTAGHGILSILWINSHPSALLAPMLAALTTRRLLPLLASCAGLLVNPFGIRAVIAPLELMAFVRSGTFVNSEWLPPPPSVFPLLFFCVAAIVVAATIDVVKRGREGLTLERVARLILVAAFAYLALRHTRNQVLFFAVFPILIAPLIDPERVPRRVAWFASAAAILLVAFGGDHRLGVAPERFPIEATERLRAFEQDPGIQSAKRSGGNIYNPDQFGGYLIWAFYPERRVLTDGRNELYRNFIPEYAQAREDNRRWRALLEKYAIDLAVDEYAPPLEVIDAASGQRKMLPASLAYWPRERWALIGFDSAAMLFARRAAFDEVTLAKWEIRGVIPDDPALRQR